MSRPTKEFWNGIGWCLIWLGIFGGIALIVWASGGASNNSNESLCIKSSGTWSWNQTADDWYCRPK